MFQVTSKVAFWGEPQPNPGYYFAKKDSPRKTEKQTNKYRAVIIRQQDKINDENDWKDERGQKKKTKDNAEEQS